VRFRKTCDIAKRDTLIETTFPLSREDVPFKALLSMLRIYGTQHPTQPLDVRDARPHTSWAHLGAVMGVTVFCEIRIPVLGLG
jgi:hypothetical protein